MGDDGELLDPGEPGTVYFRRPEGRYFRYINADDKTDNAYNDSGFFSVGDIGYLDEDGYLYLSGRSSEVIVAAGCEYLSQPKLKTWCSRSTGWPTPARWADLTPTGASKWWCIWPWPTGLLR